MIPLNAFLSNVFTGLPQNPTVKRIHHHLNKLTTSLPLVSGIIFEHKSHIKDTIDISLRLSNTDSTLPYFLEQLTNKSKYQAIQTTPIWKSICSFLSDFHSGFDDCWLEFDDENLEKKVLIPSIFINPNENQCNRDKNNLINSLTTLAGERISSKTIRNFWLLTQSLKYKSLKKGHINYVGIMLPRNEDSIRCCIKISLSQLKYFAEQYQLPITKENLYLGTDVKLLAYVDEVVLSIDIAEQISSRIGIEYPIKNPNSASELYRLLANNFDLNYSWIWGHWQRDCPHLSTLLSTEKISSIPFTSKHESCWRSIYSRRLNHFKLVFNPHSQVELKTYLYLALGWYSLESDKL